MPLFRTFFLIIALWVQALPASLAGAWVKDAAAEEKCSMSCCAWMQAKEKESQAAAATTSDCGCIEAPVSQHHIPAPANTPPVSSREILPVLFWTALNTAFVIPEIPAVQSPQFWPARNEKRQPHVRLPVLFCSFLT